MTIAGFYLTPEGIVLGADSTASALTPNGLHFFEFNQKIFEVGEGSTLALLTWGLGGFGATSIRHLVAQLDDSLKLTPVHTVDEVAQRWIDIAWPIYSAFELTQNFRALAAIPPHDPNVQESRTKEQEAEWANLRTGLFAGFCIAGYVLPSRVVSACVVGFDPSSDSKPTHQTATGESFSWWGAPNMVQRLVFGADDNLKAALLNSGKWSGSKEELDEVCENQRLFHPSLPIREAVDYVHSCIYCTIKAMKFSSFAQICGGPIEIAVITSDRKFRWVRHKPWDAAINDGELT